MQRELKPVAAATYDALSLWKYVFRVRLRDYASSWDFWGGIALGTLINIAAIFVPRPHGVPPGLFTILISTFAIVGGFFGTSLSVLIGLIPRPVARNDSLQYLNIIADFCFSVAIVFAVVLGWILYLSVYNANGEWLHQLRFTLRFFMIYLTSYAALLPFSGVQRLFRVSGAASIAEDVANFDLEENKSWD